MSTQRPTLSEPLFHDANPRTACKNNRGLTTLFAVISLGVLVFLVCSGGQHYAVQNSVITIAHLIQPRSRALLSSNGLQPYPAGKLPGQAGLWTEVGLASRGQTIASWLNRNAGNFNSHADMKRRIDVAVRAEGEAAAEGEVGAEDEEDGPTDLNPESFMPLERDGVNLQVISDAAAKLHVGFNPSFPGIEMVHRDPPVLLIKKFMKRKFCRSISEECQYSDDLIQSEEGASFLLLDEQMLSGGMRGPLIPFMREFRDKVTDLFPDLLWGAEGEEPSPGHFCFETLQFERYEEGQCFPPHEDAFRLEDANEAGFQRRISLILYLNDVAEGGQTRFEYMNISIRPRAGNLLVFFPAQASGRADVATKYAELDAVDTKWIAHQWITGPIDKELQKKELDEQMNSLGVVKDFREQQAQKGKKPPSDKGFG